MPFSASPTPVRFALDPDPAGRVRVVLGSIASALWWTDDAGRMTDAEPEWERFTGRGGRGGRGGDAHEWTQAIHPDERDGLLAAWERARSSGSALDTRARLYSAAHGGHRWCEVRAIPFVEGAPAGGRAEQPLRWAWVAIDRHEQHADRERLALYREVFANCNDGIAVVDIEGRYLEQNAAHEALIGYSAEELAGRTPAVHLGEAVFEEIARELATSGRWRGEVVSRPKTGAPVPVELSAFAVRDGAGHATCYVGIKRDISARKRADAELHGRLEDVQAVCDLSASLARVASLEEVYDLALDVLLFRLRADRAAVLLYDPDGAMRFKASRGLSSAYRAAVEGHSPWKPGAVAPSPILVPDVLEDEALAPFRATITGEGIRALAFIPLSDERRLLGKFMLYFDRAHEFSEREVRLAQTVANHIAIAVQRHRADAALRASEQRFRAVADSAPVLIWQLDASGRAVWFSEPWLRFTGRDLHQEVGRGWLESVEPADVPALTAAFAGLGAAGPAEPVRLEFRLRRADGRVRWILAHAIPGRGPAAERGEPAGAFATGVDITDHRLAEERLAAKLQELARSNADLENFAYVASHDLKEPLRGIAATAGFLLEDHGDRLTADGRERLKNLGRLTARMYDLLESLLEYARVGRGELNLLAVDASVAVAETLEGLRARLEAEDVRVEVAPSLPTVRCDRVRLGQVLSNLIVNGLKYNTSTPKRIRMGCRPGPVPVLFVQDNGIGIPAAHSEAVFRMFKRLHPRDAYGGGTGVGLAIVKKIVERHGGRIWHEPAEGGGTVFCFTLAPDPADAARRGPAQRTD